MDLRKEWESCLRTPEVHAFFLSLQDSEVAFRSFKGLEQFILFMERPSPDSYSLKDTCLWTIIHRIQTTDERTAGLSLLTYLMSKGLQAILRDSVRFDRNQTKAWSDLWWEFLETVLSYPLERRRRKVAANLLLDTRHRVFRSHQIENALASVIEPLEDHEAPIEPRFDDPVYMSAQRLIEGENDEGINHRDIALILGSRVYERDIQDLAEELGLSYDAARKRRQRAEKVIRTRWLREN